MTKKDDEEEGEIVEESTEEVATVSVEYASAVHPSNQLLLQFDQVLTQRLLAFFANWLQFPSLQMWHIEDIANADDSKSYAPSSEKMCSWIFSLMSRLEKPLYMDASATVRDIYRHLCIQRAELARKASNQYEAGFDTHQSEEELLSPATKRSREVSRSAITSVGQLPVKVQKVLAILNTVITICGKYFGQEEVQVVETPECISDNCSGVDNNNSEAVKRNDLAAKYSTLVPDEDLYNVDVDNNKNY